MILRSGIKLSCSRCNDLSQIGYKQTAKLKKLTKEHKELQDSYDDLTLDFDDFKELHSNCTLKIRKYKCSWRGCLKSYYHEKRLRTHIDKHVNEYMEEIN